MRVRLPKNDEACKDPIAYYRIEGLRVSVYIDPIAYYPVDNINTAVVVQDGLKQNLLQPQY